MKKSVTKILFATLLLTLATSCEKEGKLSKKSKIDTVTSHTSVYRDGQLMYRYGDQQMQKWFWDDNELYRIDYTEDEATYSEIVFTDKKGRISGTRIDAYRVISRFVYDGRWLDSVIVNINGQLAYSYAFTHEDKHISRINMHVGSTAAEKALTLSPLHLLPTFGINVGPMATVAAKAVESGLDAVYTLEWDHDNVSVLHLAQGDAVTDYRYTYDDNRNPYCQCLSYFELSNSTLGLDFLSENNVVTVTTPFDGNPNYTYRYTYTYNDHKLPATSYLAYTYHDINNTSLEQSEYRVEETRAYTYCE